MTDGWWPVQGASMWPIVHGMSLHAQPAAELAVGDLVIFLASTGTDVVAHRVVRVDGDVVTTRGDTNSSCDQPVPRSSIIGRVDAIRWRSWTLAMPARGRLATAERLFGRSWARLAPNLRRGWRSIRKV